MAKKRNSDVLAGKLAKVVRAGEVPYQANRRALEALDIDDDADAGMKEVVTMETGLSQFIESLKGLANAAKHVSRRVAAVR
jgi:hypothetical protein